MKNLANIKEYFSSITNNVKEPSFQITSDVQSVDKLNWIKDFISKKLAEIIIQDLNAIEKIHLSDLNVAKKKLVNILRGDYTNNYQIEQILYEIQNAIQSGAGLLDISSSITLNESSHLSVVKSIKVSPKDNIVFIDQKANVSESPKIEILMLTANPAATTKLNLDKEHSVITLKLQQKKDLFNIILKKAVNGEEFKEFTQQGKPDILHFSGHGTTGKYTGIVVQNDDKNGEELIPIEGLKALFKFFKKRFVINVVILNACYTKEQATVISQYVNYVIGTNINIGDTAATAFSSGFYFQMGEDRSSSIEDAFDSGRAAAVMKGAAEENFVIYREGKLISVQ